MCFECCQIGSLVGICLTLTRSREVDRRRPRGVTPPRGRHPGQLVEPRPAGHRDHPAGEHQLRHDRHHQQRHDLLVGLRHRRQHQAQDCRGDASAGDGDEQRERRVVEERRMRCGRTLAEPDDERSRSPPGRSRKRRTRRPWPAGRPWSTGRPPVLFGRSGRSPIRSRMVNAVPMKTAPMLSSTMMYCGWVGARPSGSAGPSPGLGPLTVSDSAPMRNGSTARNTE